MANLRANTIVGITNELGQIIGGNNPINVNYTGSGVVPVDITGGTVVATNASIGTNNTTAPTSSTQVGSVDSGGKLQAASSSNPIPVAVISGGGSNASVSSTGSAVPSSATFIGINVSGNLVAPTGLALGSTTKAETVAIVDGSGNQITSFGGGTQYTTGAAQATPIGTGALRMDGTDVRVISTDSSGQLKVLVENTVPVSGTFWQTTQPVSLTSTTITGSVAVTGTFYQAHSQSAAQSRPTKELLIQQQIAGPWK